MVKVCRPEVAETTGGRGGGGGSGGMGGGLSGGGGGGGSVHDSTDVCPIFPNVRSPVGHFHG